MLESDTSGGPDPIVPDSTTGSSPFGQSQFGPPLFDRQSTLDGPFDQPTFGTSRRRQSMPSGPVATAVGLGVGLVGLIVVLAMMAGGNGVASAPGPGEPGTLSWGDTGDKVSATQYRATEKGSTEEAMRKAFGTPATVAKNPTSMGYSDNQRCLGYRSSTADGTLYLFCFAAGRLVEKQTW